MPARFAVVLITCCGVLVSLMGVGSIARADEPGAAVESSRIVGPKQLRSPKHGGVYVVAHRGFHRGVPENSLPAYAKAIELGVDFVEIDVRATKDGKLVSVHNNRIDSYVEGASGKIGDFTLDELRTFDIGKRVGKQWIGTRIPTLDEILELCKGKCGIYLDLKEPALLDEIADTIQRHGMEGDVLWYAPVHYLERLKVFQKRYPEAILMPDPIQEKRIPALVEGLHPKIMSASWRYYSKSFVDACHEAGALVIVDESGPSCWPDALAWGSDGIQTDSPGELIAFLDRVVSEE